MTFRSIPWAAWSLMTLMAVGGSLIYGASFAIGCGLPMNLEAGLLVAIPAGAGWCCLGAALVSWSGRNLWFLAHACLVSMFWGEVWLLAGSLLNFLLAGRPAVDSTTFLIGNGVWIALSNVLMFSVWFLQLSRLGLSRIFLVAHWMLVLNGTGLLVFLLLKRGWGLG